MLGLRLFCQWIIDNFTFHGREQRLSICKLGWKEEEHCPLLKFSIVASGTSSRAIIPCLSMVMGRNLLLGCSLDLTTFLNFPTL
jgi:hypothetical protein